ncbi:hypothetical protein D7030_03555 [Flavobacteriaceae bacterium AU392]|nr:hypothetical protein D1817_10030 [Flavobacteriaceae bacterium]RKM85754.1 hypothetical protein D7030_03555 [Flavobacteriaceae bacterium AU392]
MKTIKLLYSFIILPICFLALFSCDNEPVDFEPFNDPIIASTDSYWPMAINNTWTYDVTQDGQSITSSVLELNGTEVIGGNTYFTVENFLSSAIAANGALDNLDLDTFVRQEESVYFVRLGQLTADLQGLYRLTQDGYEYTILRDNVDTGSTWTEAFEIETSFEPLSPTVPAIPGITANYTSEVEILERDMSLMVNGELFSPVIKAQQTLTVEFSDSGPGLPTTEVVSTYYFALDVGIIRVESTVEDIDNNTTTTQVQELSSFTLN